MDQKRRIAIDVRTLQDASRFRGVGNYLHNLLLNARKKLYRINALGNTYGAKDELKERGYKWDGKFWHIYLKKDLVEVLRPCPSDAIAPYDLEKVLNKKIIGNKKCYNKIYMKKKICLDSTAPFIFF